MDDLRKKLFYEQKNGYQWEANPGVVSFCTKMNAYKKTKYPGLPDMTISWWPECLTTLKKVKVVFKADKVFVTFSLGKQLQRNYVQQHKDIFPNGWLL